MAISIQNFQALTNGKYNAGELTLTKSGKLDFVNNHVSMTFFNKHEINAQDTLTIKQSLIDALRENGVNEQELQSVRKELGLSSENGDVQLTNLRPLTRAKTREILNRYAGTINAHTHEATITDRWDGQDVKTQHANKLIASQINSQTVEMRTQSNYTLALDIVKNGLNYAIKNNPELTHTLKQCYLNLLFTNNGSMMPNQLLAAATKQALLLTALKNNGDNLDLEKYNFCKHELNQLPLTLSPEEIIHALAEKVRAYKDETTNYKNDLIAKSPTLLNQPLTREDHTLLKMEEVVNNAEKLLNYFEANNQLPPPHTALRALCLFNQNAEAITPHTLKDFENKILKKIDDYAFTNTTFKYDDNGICNQFKIDIPRQVVIIHDGSGEDLTIDKNSFQPDAQGNIDTTDVLNQIKNKIDASYPQHTIQNMKALTAILNQSLLTPMTEFLYREGISEEDRNILNANIHQPFACFGPNQELQPGAYPISAEKITGITYEVHLNPETQSARILFKIQVDLNMDTSAIPDSTFDVDPGDPINIGNLGLTYAFTINNLGTDQPCTISDPSFEQTPLQLII